MKKIIVHSKRCHLSWPIAVGHSVHSCMITNHYTLKWIFIIVCRSLFVLYCLPISLQFRLHLWCFVPFLEYPSLELSNLKTTSVPFIILVCMVLLVHDGLPHVEQLELPDLPEHLSPPPPVRFVLLDLWLLCSVLYIIVCPLLVSVLSPLLRFTYFDYPFGKTTGVTSGQELPTLPERPRSTTGCRGLCVVLDFCPIGRSLDCHGRAIGCEC